MFSYLVVSRNLPLNALIPILFFEHPGACPGEVDPAGILLDERLQCLRHARHFISEILLTLLYVVPFGIEGEELVDEGAQVRGEREAGQLLSAVAGPRRIHAHEVVHDLRAKID